MPTQDRNRNSADTELWRQNLGSIQKRFEKLKNDYPPLGCIYGIYFPEQHVEQIRPEDFSEVYWFFGRPINFVKPFVFPFELRKDGSKIEAIYPFWSETLELVHGKKFSENDSSKEFHRVFFVRMNPFRKSWCSFFWKT